jgi:hypothetical protein
MHDAAIRLSPRWIVRVAVAAVVALAVANLLAHAAVDFVDRRVPSGWLRLFDLNREQNLPTWFSSALLLCGAFAAAAVAAVERAARAPFTRHWQGLAFVMLYLSVDEAAVLHESTVLPLRRLFDAGGVFAFTWIVPALAAVVILAIVYRRFVLQLPAPIRRCFFAAAALFVGGSIGGDMIGGWYLTRAGYNGGYVALFTVEEIIEFLGAIAFLYGALRHLGERAPDLRLRIGAGSSGAPLSPGEGCGEG